MNGKFSFFLVLLPIFLWCLPSQAQLGFCNGNSGDAIFFEDFGTGTSPGPQLAAGTTTYSFVTGTPNDGSYTLLNTTPFFDWHRIEDHTPNDINGKSFIVNADFTAGEFFRRTVNGLCENTSYEFSSWLINLLPASGCFNAGIPINVKFQIWDTTDTQLLASGDTGPIPGTATPQWEKFGLVFQTLPGQTSVILKMLNNGEGGCGNDLAIDDIVFKTCGDFVEVTDTENNSNVLRCQSDGPLSTTLTATPDFSIYSTHAYQWQQSTDGITWIDILGANTNVFQVIDLNSTRFYRAKVAEDAINLANPLCIALSEVFDIIVIPPPDAPQTQATELILCPDENETISVSVPSGVTVNWYDQATNGTLLAQNTMSYAPTNTGIFYAEAMTISAACASNTRTALTVDFYEVPLLTDESLVFCEGTTRILDVEANNMTYLWNTGEITQQIAVNTPGDYSVMVTTPNGCQRNKTISLSQIDAPVIDRIISSDFQLTVNTSNTGDFEYSLNGFDFQDSPIFENTPGGLYTIFVRERSGCGIALQAFVHLVVPKFFTPNGDSQNDLFQPQGFEFLSDYEISIFNRYGQLVKASKNQPINWDGSFNGSPLPAADYWYRIRLKETEFKGHFSLKR